MNMITKVSSSTWQRRGICGYFFLSLSFSCSQVIMKKSSNDTFFVQKEVLVEKILIWVKKLPNDDLFTQYLFLKEKKTCHLMTFSWWLESERTRAIGKRNHKSRALIYPQYNQLQLVLHHIGIIHRLHRFLGHYMLLQRHNKLLVEVRKKEQFYVEWTAVLLRYLGW